MRRPFLSLAFALLALPAFAQAPGTAASPSAGSPPPAANGAPPTPAAAAASSAPTAPIRSAGAGVPRGQAKPNAAPAPQVTTLKKVDVKGFDAALQAYFSGNPREAAAPLYAFLLTNPQTDDNYPWAQYFLARSLADLGLRHAAAFYLAKVAHERANPQAVSRALETLKSLTDLPHDETMIDEQVFGSLDLGFLPEEVADYAHYQQGLVDLKVGNERWATTHFSKLVDTSVEASRAKFATLVNRLRVSKDVPDEMVEEFYNLAKDPKLSQETRNEAMLAVARLRYEKKDYEGALKNYNEVVLPPLDPGRATLYVEEAWTRYRLGQLHAAMGILTTLDAPVFRDEFTPDKYLLRAMVYRDLCHYLPAKRAAKELTRRFAESLEAVREREDLTQDPRLRRAAAAEGPTRRAARFQRLVQLEAEGLGKYAGSFGEKLYSHLAKLYELTYAEAQRVFQERLEESVRQEADKLLRAAEQVRLMEYEVGLKLYERVKKGSKLVVPLEEEALTSGQVAFGFDGEYWNDELRSYRVSLKSRCIEENLQ